jgi:hypothetical protein
MSNAPRRCAGAVAAWLMAFGRWRHNTSFRLCSFEEALAEEKAKMAQIKLTRPSPRYWRITFDNPPLNLMGPEFVLEFRR